MGLEGVQVQSLHHAAQIAAREARAANRTARFTPRLMPVKHKAAATAAVKTTAVAEAAAAAYKKARTERRRARQTRAAVVYGPPLAAITAGYAELGTLGAAAGLLATFTGGRVRRPPPDHARSPTGPRTGARWVTGTRCPRPCSTRCSARRR